jgi:hypothetical protein
MLKEPMPVSLRRIVPLQMTKQTQPKKRIETDWIAELPAR